MKSLSILLFFISFFSAGVARENPLWLRSVSISPDGDEIAFTYKGNIYKVAVTGGQADQLTFHTAHDFMPVWSNDGKEIAFASDRYGNFDLFIMPGSGGAAERLTYHSNNEYPYDFSSDGSEIIFGANRMDLSTHRQYPTGSQPELYKVPKAGGRVDLVFTVPAEYAHISKDGEKLYYHDKKGGEDEYRKHHTSSITRDLWVYDVKSAKHTKITDFIGEDRQPVLSADENFLYYLSEQSGTFNIYKRSLTGQDSPVQLTNFTDHPVRFLSSAKGTICFGYDGEIYTMEEGGSPTKVNIEIKTQDVQNKDKYIDVSGGIEEMAVSPDGKEIAFIARGEVFVTSVDEGFTKRITKTPERERFVTFTHDGNSVVYSSEREGKWSIFKSSKVRSAEPFFYAATLLNEEPLILNESDNYLAEFSPDGKKMAWIQDRRILKVRELESGNETIILDSGDLFHMRDGDKYFKWSPDSKWLLVDWGKSLSNSEILLAASDGSKKVNLTQSGYYDYQPKWVNQGKQMLWFSNKDGLKSYANSGNFQSDVYAMFFTEDAWVKFNLTKDEKALADAVEEQLKKKDKKDDKKDKEEKTEEEEKETIEDLTFDWDALEDRTARLTIHSSSLGYAVLSKDGEKLYYLARFEDNMNLWSTNLRTKETKIVINLNARGGSLEWDKDGKNLFLLSGGKISKIDPEAGKNKPVIIDGEMDMDEDAERKYIFDHVWIRTNAIFYHPDFHGVDWDKMYSEYGKFVPHVGNNFEMAEVLSEMLGELNVSHAGARYRGGIPNGDETASLGIFYDYTYDDDGIRIVEIIKGGPLDKSEYQIKPGDIILEINGDTIKSNVDPARYLNRISGNITLLTILDPGSDSTKHITVKPISLREENQLLYKRWVRTNEDEVKIKSGGKLGYVHLPGMSDGPYRNIYSDMMGKYSDCEAVIVDTRFNGGGDLVGDLAMFFTGQPFITYATEDKVVGGEPYFRWTKPTLALINEAQYSDGHCFACGYTDLKIGKAVGMPTPGTCSFAGWEGLPNGTVWGVVPVSAKDINGDWMENNQTEPDILVKNMPGIIDNGRDQQLERGIEELMKEINN